MRRLAASMLPAVLVALIAAATAAADPVWKLEQPAPPPGSPFAVPLGTPGDLKFIAPNRGLLAVEGNATVSPGLYAYDGTGWHQLSTVCGTAGRDMRIAIAGPDEFWTITDPSQPRHGEGTALCHFKDGNVIASYSTPPESPDPYRRMDAAACNGPNDCWFGGFSAEDATGERRGAFHLHWDGTSLETVYAPQGRAVTDIEYYGGKFYETVLLGTHVGDQPNEIDPYLFEDEGNQPRLIHRIEDGMFQDEPFIAGSENAELLALGLEGDSLWAVGGGASSGPAPRTGAFAAREPLAVRLVNGNWVPVPLAAGAFSTSERFVDVAPVPGTDTAWVAVDRADQSGTSAPAHVARIAADGTVDSVTQLPPSGPAEGEAAKIAFTAPNDGWLVTSQGWVFHYTDGTPLQQDTDPAFRGPITFRPNEAAEQFVPDTPPADDSELFKPPPVEVQQQQPPPKTKRLPPLLRRIRSKLRGKTLEVRFVLTRKAKVALIARRKRRVVARTKARMMRAGRHVLRLRLDPARWPQRLKLAAHEPGVPTGGGGGNNNGDTITTGGDTVATSARSR
jgi:hypothetical protein